MNMKRFLAIILSLVMVTGMLTAPFFAEEQGNLNVITVYMNVSKHGEILKDKFNDNMANLAIELTGKSEYNLNDVFVKLHEDHCEGGKDEYAFEDGYYGPYITEFWGDNSGNFGYFVNGIMSQGISEAVQNGDVIDVVIYKNSYPNTENYSKFDKYTAEAYEGEDTELVLYEGVYDESYNMSLEYCADAKLTIDGVLTEYKTGKDGKVKFAVLEAGEHIISAYKEKTVDGDKRLAIAAPTCVMTVKKLPDAMITVPKNATLFVGSKGKMHFVPFTEIKPAIVRAKKESTTYYFELDDKSTYNYRVFGDDYITYGGTFKKAADFSLDITEEQLKPSGKTKTTVDKDTASNSGYNVGDIYLNINPKGYLSLEKGDTFQIVSLRNWEAINTITGNYFIEPDYHYEVIDELGNKSNVVTVNENGLLSAKNNGVAIVLVTYDAMTLNFGKEDDFYGAIWPENTGVFVVSVGEKEANIEAELTINEGLNSPKIKLAGDKIDAEHDCIYFTGNQGSYTFTPQDRSVNVYVANPTVKKSVTYKGFSQVVKNSDNSITVPLTAGRNIVKLEKDGKVDYQIITAKKVNITVPKEVRPGETITIEFDKIYHPANKVAGIYNMFAAAIYQDVSAYEGQIVGTASNQHTFGENAQTITSVLKVKMQSPLVYANDTELTVPQDYEYDTFKMSGGVLFVSGWGDEYGAHRNVTYEVGRSGNNKAAERSGFFGTLPDIVIPVKITDAEVQSISLNTDDVQTAYYSGDEFNKENLAVTVNYSDGEAQLTENYTISPKILTADTKKVIVSYMGKTAEISVTVTNPVVESIEITKVPNKTQYKVGEVFNPSGMVVTAVYKHGVRKEISEYSYSPNRALETSDEEMIISYTGANGGNTVEPVLQPITVTESEGSGSSSKKKITVQFTLLGDDAHGAPTGSGDTHTKKKGNLETWISKTEITLDKGSCVIDAVEKALGLYGIPFTNEGNYIAEIKGLSEFSNGSSSGWMYQLNGKYVTKGVDEQKLSDGDKIVFHYTDDFTQENTGFSSGPSSAGASDTKGGSDKKEDKNEEMVLKPSFNEKTYKDVKVADWYWQAVKYVYENNLMTGTGENFEPYSEMTRAMFVTVLWRMENEPAVSENCKFFDVKSGDWFYEAVKWAKSQGVIEGINSETFGSNDKITREQLVTILYRYMQKKQHETKTEEGALLEYGDAAEISPYALLPMKWAVSCGVINGTTKTTLSGTNSATRGEVAVMLMRFCQGILK